MPDTAIEERDHPLVYLSAQFIQAKQYLEAILGSTSDAIITTDLRGRVMYFSPGAEKLLCRRSLEAVGAPAAGLYARGRQDACTVMRMLLAKGSISDHETALLTADGREVPVSMSAALLRDPAGRIIGTLGISKDISRRLELERRLREMSITDAVTDLYNHRHFEERVCAEVQRAKRLRQDLSLLVIDLDRFKEANDLWGHLEGDRILRETAAVLKQCLRRDVDAAFRYGGDEFVVLLPGLDAGNAAKVAERIRKSSEEKTYASVVTLSIGSSTLLDDDGVRDLVRRADAQMYRVKRAKKRASSPGD
ncbi:MAG: sensor domain-containing diguanylate cyclase [Elusimicrobiota bacterium]